MAFVLDCSVTMAWCFEDEASLYADQVLERLAEEEALVPSLWALEVSNVLIVGERRKRIQPADSARFLAMLSDLPIRMEQDIPGRTFHTVLPLAREQRLSAYDAAYLELALRRGIPIATTDTKVRPAAQALGVPLLGADEY
jgi:predicted nucleic acid-binding protein